MKLKGKERSSALPKAESRTFDQPLLKVAAVPESIWYKRTRLIRALHSTFGRVALQLKKAAVPEYIWHKLLQSLTKGSVWLKAKRHLKKAAVPEYIWYISLIIISITLVVGIANIAKKGNKNIEPPSNVNIQFDVQTDPHN